MPSLCARLLGLGALNMLELCPTGYCPLRKFMTTYPYQGAVGTTRHSFSTLEHKTSYSRNILNTFPRRPLKRRKILSRPIEPQTQSSRIQVSSKTTSTRPIQPIVGWHCMFSSMHLPRPILAYDVGTRGDNKWNSVSGSHPLGCIYSP